MFKTRLIYGSEISSRQIPHYAHSAVFSAVERPKTGGLKKLKAYFPRHARLLSAPHSSPRMTQLPIDQALSGLIGQALSLSIHTSFEPTVSLFSCRPHFSRSNHAGVCRRNQRLLNWQRLLLLRCLSSNLK
ncbi:hypothetical protein [Methylomicrobium lacus]|uniref:hypothetical protein n=1 Tax=Methylomicrobium lacus TaxID=136992 RepID=UPI0035A9A7EE